MSQALHDTMLTYAHQDSYDGPLVYVDYADSNKKYFCPKCKKEVFPKNRDFDGRVLPKHYAHVAHSDCQGAQMTLLHNLALQIIAEHKSLMLPLYPYCDFSVEEPSLASFSKVVLEETDVFDTGLRPDCKCTYVDKSGDTIELWVEIYVTHKVDPQKQRRIFNRNKYCVEIDLNRFVSCDDNQKTGGLLESDIKEKLTDFLINCPDDRWWIHNPKYDEKNSQLKKEFGNAPAVTPYRYVLSEEEALAISAKKAEEKDIEAALNEWFSNHDEAAAQRLIDIIRADAENPRFEGSYARNELIFDRLTNDNIISYFIDHSPQNNAQQMLFDALCKYYYPKFTSGYFSIEKTIEEFSKNHTPLDNNETRRLSQYVIAYFIALGVEPLRNNDESRRNILICCSFLYHHILSQNIHDYPTLIKFVVDKKPELAKLCLMAVNYVSNDPDDYSYRGHNWLENLRQSADNNAKDMDTYKILSHVYPEIFMKNK